MGEEELRIGLHAFLRAVVDVDELGRVRQPLGERRADAREPVGRGALHGDEQQLRHHSLAQLIDQDALRWRG